MEFRVLGPLEVWADGVAIPTGTRKQQIVWAVLLTNANRLVSLSELVDELWPEEPPRSAIANVRGYVGNIRRMCNTVGPDQDRLARRGAGYMLQAKASELDLLAFLADSVAGRAAVDRGDLKEAASRYGMALTRWRGAVAGGVLRGAALDAPCKAMEDERLAVVDEFAQVLLSLDQPSQAVALLREHVHAHPLRERLHALLMRALYRSGDIAGALAVFADARAVLVDQLGIEPGEELQELQRMPGAEAVLLHNLGEIDVVLGRLDDAVAAGERSLATRREIEDLFGVGSTLRSLAVAYCLRGDLVEAIRCATEAIEVCRQSGDELGIHFGLLTRSEVHRRRRSGTEALADADAALHLARDRGDRYTEALALHQKAGVLSGLGEDVQARRLRCESVDVFATVQTRSERLLELLLKSSRPGSDMHPGSTGDGS